LRPSGCRSLPFDHPLELDPADLSIPKASLPCNVPPAMEW
jgi:hypothetical protein